MSKEILSQVKETIKFLTVREKEDLVKYLLNQESKEEKDSVLQVRVAGLHRGNVWMSEDFNEPLPDEFWLGEQNS